MSDPPMDPLLAAIMAFVHNMCTVAMAETTGFANSRTANEDREKAMQDFKIAWEKNLQDGGP